MKKIPFAFLPEPLLKQFSLGFRWIAEPLGKVLSFLDLNLKQANLKIEKEEYISLSLVSVVSVFILIFSILAITFFSLKAKSFILAPIGIALIFSFFIFFYQIYYPRLLSDRRIRLLERHLMPALQDFSVQINAGIPLFNILVNIAHSNYGEVSNEFKIIVKEINVGVPQVKALEESALKNPSIFFRRSLWQIINGLKAGSDMSTVIQEAINALSEEQILQIQVYGGKLNPLAMFYMLIAIIVPALSVTFIIILSSFLSFSEFLTKTIFYSILTATTFFQIIFLGIIKTRRPNLLS